MKRVEQQEDSAELVAIPKIPESVASVIAQKNAEIMELFESRATKPHIILVLERSAVLPAASVTKQIQEQYPETKIVPVPVGKILPYMFAEYQMSIDDDFDEVDLDLSDSQQMVDFLIWLNSARDVTVQHLKAVLKSLRLRGKNVLVIDDAKSSGETIDQTLPLLLRAVYRRPVRFTARAYFEGSFSWEAAVIQEMGLDLTPAETKLMGTVLKGSFDLRRFKIELESGFYDSIATERHLRHMRTVVRRRYVKGATGIIPVDSQIVLKMAGYQAMLQLGTVGKSAGTENPAYGLLKKLGMDALKNLHVQAQQKFEQIS